jgi:hypothetical protein
MTAIVAEGFSLRQADDFALQQAVRDLLCWSDAQDAALKARLAAEAAAQQCGYDAGFEAGRRAVLEYLAEEKRQLCAEQAGLASRPLWAEIERIRWHLCCMPCRRGGHRRGCPDCREAPAEGGRLVFADPMPGEYLGGPVRWAA